jgi:hypothetical protein
MFRFALLILLSASAYAARAVDIDTAATVYQDAAIREQVRASLGAMPEHIRQLFAADGSAHLSDEQLSAVTDAAKHGFRIDVFEVPALSAFAANLDADTVKKSKAFLSSDLGHRMVTADVATARLSEDEINKIMNGAESPPSTPQRDALLDKLERASRSTESTVQIFLSMGQAVAAGTAVGAGGDRAAAGEKARKAGDSSRADMEASMRAPLRRYLAYSYRDMSDADLKRLLKFLESQPGKNYVSAYIALLDAGFTAMGRRCGEQLGESLRELAQAQLDVPMSPPPSIAAPAPTTPPTP